jgi:hypothetical protein
MQLKANLKNSKRVKALRIMGCSLITTRFLEKKLDLAAIELTYGKKE